MSIVNKDPDPKLWAEEDPDQNKLGLLGVLIVAAYILVLYFSH